MKNNNVKDYSNFIKELAQTIKDSDLSGIEFNHDLQQSIIRIKVTKNKEIANNSSVYIPQPVINSVPVTQASVSTTSSTDLSKHLGAVLSPMVGIAYTSPNPDSEDFVKVGSTVKEGDIVLLIEAMKVFNPVKAPRSGKVTQILVNSNQAIEFGEVLLIIE